MLFIRRKLRPTLAQKHERSEEPRFENRKFLKKGKRRKMPFSMQYDDFVQAFISGSLG
jgi:hypothetical protein